VCTRTGLDDVERRKILSLPGLELRSLGRPARSQLQYRQRYPGSLERFLKNDAVNYFPEFAWIKSTTTKYL
jgi:hypothetical protein